MSSLTAADKTYVEKILGMGSGYVLNFTNETFGQFFGKYGVAIHGSTYQLYGTSKAKKMRAFWEKESDLLVGQVLSEMLDVYEALSDSSERETDVPLLRRCRGIVAKLTGMRQENDPRTDEWLLSQAFELKRLDRLPVDLAIMRIIEERLDEAQRCLSAGAYLSVIIQCGGILEAVLLGAAHNEPARFNRAKVSPKKDGRVKAFYEWSLAELINVSYEIDLLKLDVQKFSHGLRDFRNYIHPYQQVLSEFRPDEHTARVCLQVLRAALADVAGER